MQLPAILTLIALAAGMTLPPGSPAFAQVRDQARVAAAQQTRGDDAMVEMGLAFRKGDRVRLSALLPLVSGHLLEPWGAYWELKARLETASAAEVQDFFTRYAGTYQEDRLRNDWLLLTGQRRDWASFATEYPHYRMGDDREVRCYALAADTAPTSDNPADEVKRLWHAQRDADDGCSYAAARLHAAGKLKDADVWRKARLAMEANRPKAAKLAAEMVAPDAADQIGDISDNPARYLSKHVIAASKVRKEWVLLALIRMASNDADAAAAALENHWSVHLSPEQRSWAWGAIGKSAAQKLSDEAYGYFAKAKNSDLSDEHLAWKVRAALRKPVQPNWKEVFAATSAMSDEARQDPAWVYWRARAQLRASKNEADNTQATAALQSIAGVRGFYEQLAQEELGQRISVPTKPLPLTPEEKDGARQNAGLKRGLHAIALGLRADGVREWNYTTNLHAKGGMNDRELLAAADYACLREVWDRCINTSERTKAVFDMEQRFPMPHQDAVVKRATQIGLDPAYVYGLIRQESRFIMDARSGVGASGLMQVMPATARWTAKKIGLADFQAQQINDRDTNIAIGTGYLKLVLDDFAGSMPLAAAAYNAGPSRPRSWRGASGGPVLEAAIWAENIPFAETRDYVKKVLSNTTAYAALISGQPQSLKARLGAVGPRDGAAPEVNKDLP
jgi:soluble lytic murein transglycosylase